MDFGFRTLRGATDVNGKHFLTNSHSTDSRAPTIADPAERASNEKLHFRLHEKYPKARKSAIFLKCAKLHKMQGKEFTKFDTEAASKFHLPKQHLPRTRFAQMA